MQFSQDLDPVTKKQIEAGARMMATLRQKNSTPMPFQRQSVVIYAAIHGYLEKVPTEKVPEFEEKFLAFLDSEAPQVLESIARARDIVSQTEEELKVQLQKFTEIHGWA